MAGKSYLNTIRGERIDQPDFQHAAESSQRIGLDIIGDQFLVGDGAALRMWVIKGFTLSVVSPTITLTGGIGILGYRDRGTVRYGMLVTEGADSRSVNLGSYANSQSYGVYVRGEYVEDAFGNRIFWDALATPSPGEEITNIPTRRTENWSLAVEAAAPGPEWLQVGTAIKDGGGVVTITQATTRNLFFEGRSGDSYRVTDTQWGGGNDRNADRATYGVFGLQRAIRGLQRQVQDLIGITTPSDGWWDSFTKGVDDLLALDGSRDMTGHLLPNANNTLDLGATTDRWRAIYGVDADFSDDVLVGDDLQVTGDVLATGPSSTLRVTSTITADLGNYTWGVSNTNNTFTKSISGTAAQIPSTITAAIIEWEPQTPVGGTRSNLKFNTTSAIKTAVFPLELPDGATIMACRLYGSFDDGAASNDPLRATIVRKAHDPAATPETMYTGTYTVLTDGTNVTRTLDLDQNTVINNSSYSYYVWVSSAGAGGLDASMTLTKVAVDYKVITLRLP